MVPGDAMLCAIDFYILSETMSNPGIHKNLGAAKSSKKDEFYTQLSDIERELKHYRKHFRGKVVYCNCDDPRVSNFFHYFSHNFEKLGLKKLLTTCYKNQQMDAFSQNEAERAIALEYDGTKNENEVPDLEDIGIRNLKGDGDFRNQESIELLKEADIVVTNPPFSLFRQYVAQLIEHNKKFVIIGHQNAISYKGIFELIRDDKLWLGYGFKGGAAHFITHYDDHATAGDKRDGMVRVSGVNWFTNLDIDKRHEDLILYQSYSPKAYPQYDNYDAIEVSKTKDIPSDYFETMGVPITYLDKYNPDQYEIIGITQSWADGRTKIYPHQTQVSAAGVESRVTKLNDGPALRIKSPPTKKTYYKVDGQMYSKLYARVLIRKRK